MAQIQNIYTGSKTITESDGVTVDIAVPSVAMANSFVMCTYRNVNSSADRVQRELWTYQLTSSTNVQLTRHESDYAVDSVVEWTVLEFDSSVTVHRGSASPSTASSSHSIGATINVGSSFPITAAKTDLTELGSTVVCRTSLSTTNITFDFYSAPGANDCTIEWQIVEFDSADADVQEGTITISSGNASNTATITSLDTSKTFIAHGGMSTSNTYQGEHRNQCSLELTNSTTVTAKRTVIGSTADQVIQYYAVEMLDGSTVESGTTTIANGSTTPTTQPSLTAMSNPSFINTHYLQNDRNTDTTTDQHLGDECATISVDGTKDGLTLTRGASDGPLEVNWFAVDWNASGGGGPTTHYKSLSTSGVGAAGMSSLSTFGISSQSSGVGSISMTKMMSVTSLTNATGSPEILKETKKQINTSATGSVDAQEGLLLEHSSNTSATGSASLSTRLIINLGGTIRKAVKTLVRNIVRNIVRFIS